MQAFTRIINLEVIDSSNLYVLENFESLPDLALVVARGQTAGRGRRSRKWFSPSGLNIYATWALKSFPLPSFTSSWAISVAGIEFLRRVAPTLDFWIKWPNDIYCGRKKIAGVLCETKSSSGNKTAVIAAGIGFNINMTRRHLKNIEIPATSIMNETGNETDLGNASALLASVLDEVYGGISSGGIDFLYQKWKAENRLFRKKIQVIPEKGEPVDGIFHDIGPSGELILKTEEGKMSFHSGDVSLGKYLYPPL